MSGTRVSVTHQVIGYSDATGFSGTHSVLDWESLRRGALGGEDDVAAYMDLEKRTVTRSMREQGTGCIYVEPLGNRCFDTRVFASDELDGFVGKQEGEVVEIKDEEEDVVVIKDTLGVQSGEETPVVVKTSRDTTTTANNKVVVSVKSETLEAAVSEEKSVDRKSPSEVGMKKKRGRPRSLLGPDGRKYTAEELKLPSEDWKAYIVLNDSGKEGRESMVYYSPEGLPCYSVEMMNSVEKVRQQKVDVDTYMSGLMRNVRALQLNPLFKHLVPESMGMDTLMLQRIGHARQTRFKTKS